MPAGASRFPSVVHLWLAIVVATGAWVRWEPAPYDLLMLATLGLGALLQASPAFFVAFKLAGAAYLAWLGAKDLLARPAALSLARLEARTTARLLADGALSNLLNPYVVLFFFAFMPQFVSPDAKAPPLTIAALGLERPVSRKLMCRDETSAASARSSWLRPRCPRQCLRSAGNRPAR